MPKLKIYKWILTVLLFLFISSLSLQTNAQTNSKVYSKFNINRISTYIYNDGIADIQPNGNSGFEFPKGSSKAANFCGGFIWGGKIDGAINVGGAAYRAGLSPGKILSNGKAADLGSDDSRVFRVRRDYKTADLNIEAEDEDKTASDIYDQYEKDWNQWPAADGAPFEDVNKNGIYEPSIDIPGILGANQTLWFVANDLDSNRTRYFSGTLPIGIEMQVTVWGYKYDGTYRGDALFKRYIVINKSSKEIKETRFGIWADPDVGDAGDDLVGCDTTLNMAYMFGSTNQDAQYGSFSPAFGYSLLQGPIVNGFPDDKAIFKNKIVSGKKNLQMSALGWVFKGGDWGDPQFGNTETSFELYNFLKGKSKLGLDVQIPSQFGGGITKFPYSGDYVRKIGFYDGVESRSSDRRMMLCVGPFNMAAGDTQEVVFMESAAGADRIKSHLEAIDQLKKDVVAAKKNYTHENKYYLNPATLTVDIINLDRRVVLDWGENKNELMEIEKGYYEFGFQGYNVYQFTDSSYTKSTSKLVATYDKYDDISKFAMIKFDNLLDRFQSENIFYSRNSGITRYYSLTKDAFTNESLVNWKELYLGVSYFSSRKDGDINYYLESDVFKCRALPTSSSDGTNNNTLVGTYFPSSHVSGTTDEYQIYLQAINPSRFGNYDYEVSFKQNATGFYLNLKNLTTGKDVFTDVSLENWTEQPHFDGIRLSLEKSYFFKKLLTISDVFRFSTKASSYNNQLLLDDLKKINVFPNPFYGLAKMDTQNNDKFVTFTHLPQRAVIKIFNVSGQIVRTIEKDSPGKTVKWDLSNNNGFIVAGGMYVALVELPESGKTKILKLIVIPSSSLPQFF